MPRRGLSSQTSPSPRIPDISKSRRQNTKSDRQGEVRGGQFKFRFRTLCSELTLSLSVSYKCPAQHGQRIEKPHATPSLRISTLPTQICVGLPFLLFWLLMTGTPQDPRLLSELLVIASNLLHGLRSHSDLLILFAAVTLAFFIIGLCTLR
jgi:hypothetical protein